MINLRDHILYTFLDGMFLLIVTLIYKQTEISISNKVMFIE